MICLCMCVAHAYNAHGGTLGLELQAEPCVCWKQSPGPLQKQVLELLKHLSKPVNDIFFNQH